MRSIFVTATVDEKTRVWTGNAPISHFVHIGDGLSLSLPLDIEKRKETLLWLATQFEMEAQKL